MGRWTFVIGTMLGAALIIIMNISVAQAADVPQSFTLDGRLYSDAASTTPLQDGAITFTIQILDDAKVCVVYEESQIVSTAASKGYFSMQVGTVTGSPLRTAGDSANAMPTIFQNITTINGKLLSNGAPCTVSATGGNRRYVRVKILPPSMGGVARTLLPDLTIDSVPNAIVAERAESLQGLRATNVLQVNTSSGSTLSQTNLESLFTSTARFNALSSVIDGTSVNYMRSNATGGANLPVMAGAPTSPVPGAVWYDSSDSKIKFQTSVGPVIVGTGAGTVTSVGFTAPSELSVAGAPVTTTGTIAVTWATQTTNKVFAAPDGVTGTPSFRVLVANDVPNLPWTKITSMLPTTLLGYGITDAVKNAGGTPSIQSGLDAAKGAAATAGRVWISTDTKEIYSDNGTTWDLIGKGASSGGTVTSVSSANAYLSVATGTTTPALTVNVGTAVNTVAAGNDSRITGALPAATAFAGDVSGVYSATSVDKIKGTAVSITALGTGNFFRFNGTNWVNSNLTSGDVTTGLTYTPLNKAGDTMTGLLVLSADPAANLGASTKQYVDSSTTSAAANYLRKDATVALTADWDADGAGAGTRLITGLADPAAADGAATKNYADTKFISRTLPAVPAIGQNGQSIRWNNAGAAWEYYTPSTGTGDFLADGTIPMTGTLKMGGNAVYGNSTASGNLTLESTSNATKGYVNLQPTGGNVGIGTASPNTELDVVGQVYSSGGMSNNGYFMGSNTNYGMYEFSGNTHVQGGFTGFFLKNTNAAGPTEVFRLSGNNGSSVNILSALNNGNVGVGTATPSTTLDVNGGQTFRGVAAASAPPVAAQGKIYFDSTANKFKVSENNGAYVDLVGGGGTVTSVSSANSYLSVATGTTTPALTLNVGTAANTVAAGDDSRITGALPAATAFAGDVSGVYSATSVDKIKGTGVAITTITSGNFLKYNGTNWVNSMLAAGDVTGALTYTPVNKAGDTMTGLLVLSADPAANLGASTKQYVDSSTSTAAANYLRKDATVALTADWDADGAGAGTRLITGLADPAAADGAATKNYADTKFISRTLPAVPAVGQNGQSIRWNNAGAAWEYYTPSTGTGDFKADGSVAMTGAFKAADGSFASPAFQFESDATAGIYKFGTGDLALRGGGTTVFRINSSGAGFFGNGDAPHLAPNNGVGTPGYSFVGDTNTGFWHPAADTVALSTNGSERLRVDASGNVGIGTTAPGAKLDIIATAITSNPTVKIRSADNTSSSTATIGLMNNTGAVAGLIGTYGDGFGMRYISSDYMAFSPGVSSTGLTSTGEKMRIDVSGNVGIGTAGPTSKLHGVTTMNAATGNEIAYSLEYTTNKATSGNDTGLLIKMTDTVSPGTSLPLDIQVGGSSVFSVNQAGVVTGNGSGLTGVAASFPLLAPDGTVGAPSYSFSGSTNTGLYRSGGNVFVSNAGNAAAQFTTSGLLDGGNVDGGFYLKSNLSRSESTPVYTFNGDNNTGVFSPAADIIALTTNGTEKMRVDSSGKVGIGTSSPSSMTEIFGTNAVLTLTGTTASGGSTKIDFKRNGGSVNASIVSSEQSNNDYNYMSFWTRDAAGNLERMRIDRSGNVGIGTTTPATTLDISGGQTFRGVAAASAPPTASQGKIYFDSTANKFKVSENNGAYVDLVGGGGTVTSVSSANSYLSVATGTTTPALTLNVGTAANTVAAGNDSRITGALPAATAFAGDVSGVYSATSVDKIKGTGVAITTITSGNFLKYNGTNWVNSNLAAGDITGALTYTPVNKAGDTMTGLLVLSADPSAALGAATKQYTDSSTSTAAANYLRKDATVALTADWDVDGAGAGTRLITGLAAPVAGDGAATKNYADTQFITRTLPAAPAVGQNGQSIRWNNGTTAWEYYTPGTGTGDFLANGTIPMTGTLKMGGNTVHGDSTASGNLTLDSTSDATKGFVSIAPTGGNVGIGTTAPVDPFSIGTAINASATRALVNLSNTALVAGSANGTYLGANPAAFTGNFIELQVGGTSKFKVDSAGKLYGDGSTLTGVGNGNFKADGSVAMTGPFQATDGAAAAPSISFAADLDTGFFRIAANTISVSTGGTMNYHFNTTAFKSADIYGFQLLNTAGSAATPSYSWPFDTDTGLFRAAADVVAISTAGSERVRIDATGNVGIGTTTPGASSILDISSTTKGVVLPRMTKAQRDAIASPVAGMAVYQTDNTPGLRVYNGTNWMRFTETAD